MSSSRNVLNNTSLSTGYDEAEQLGKEEIAHKSLPMNWPEDITYLTIPRHSAMVLESAKILPQLRRQESRLPRDSKIHRPSTEPIARVEILHILDTRHPACGQYGLFTTHHLAPDAFILPYFGLVHSSVPEDTDESSDYDLSLDRDLMVAIDAAQMGNEARFMNDYRGVPRSAGNLKGANAEFRDIWIEFEDGVVEKGIGVFVLTAGKSGLRKGGIRAGEEILVNYGKGFWSHRVSEFGKPVDIDEGRQS